MNTLDLKTSKRIFELIGEYETEKTWFEGDGEMGTTYGFHTVTTKYAKSCFGATCYPAPDFGELIRILPKIGEKMGWNEDEIIGDLEIYCANITSIYIHADSPSEGMKDTASYLDELIG